MLKMTRINRIMQGASSTGMPLEVLLLSILALLTLCVPVRATDEEVITVRSSNAAPYLEALQGFQSAFGTNAPSYVLSDGPLHVPSSVRVIVTLGGKAALYDKYPPHISLIYCLAPGTRVDVEKYANGILKVHTAPSALVTLAEIIKLQPSLKRLAVIWAGDSTQDYLHQASEVKERFGVQMISVRIRDAEDLPDKLRGLKNTIDGIWMPPDARMITPTNFATINEFTLANGIPFYVPSAGLVEQGASASISSTFAEIGALAARMIDPMQNNTLKQNYVFPEKAHVTVNTSPKKSRLSISGDTQKQAEKVLP